jgi:multiple sugar transport system substrate-binding protein
MSQESKNQSRMAQALSRRTFIKQFSLLGVSSTSLGLWLAACGGRPAVEAPAAAGDTAASEAQPVAEAADQEPAELLFTFWGSPVEKSSVEQMVASFNQANPTITVRAQHIPTTNNAYTQKITTMVASGTPPDVAYLDGALAFTLAAEGKLLDLTPFFEQDAEAKSRLDQTYYRYQDKIFGASIGEIMLLYYNKDLFDAAQLDYPPSKAESAWTWDEFVDVAKKLTKDNNGRDATSPDFDPDSIETYGLAFPQTINGYLPMIYSNGGDLVDEAGTKLLLDQPEAVEVLQKMQDLIYVHHVAPTPAQAESFPATDVLMMTGKIAMDFNGHWKILDYSQTDMKWGMGVLPRFKEPATLLQASARVVFAGTKNPAEAFTFYKYHFSPASTDLFKKGLWMPAQLEYYTDEAKIKEWLDGEPGVYPPEARDVLLDYTLKHARQSPVYWIENFQQILNEALNPAMQLLWTGKATAQEIADEAVAKANPLLASR